VSVDPAELLAGFDHAGSAPAQRHRPVLPVFTATSCRSTRISAFFDRELQARRPSHATSCPKMR
jgi:hypothetical protein